MTSELFIGLMSGTSLDAVDAVVASINQSTVTLLHSHTRTIPSELREQILSISTDHPTPLSTIGLIDHKLGKLYANTVNELLKKAQLSADSITAIGNHGQTVCHQPTGESRFTIQLGDANLIAALTGIDTIADFRRIDIALGGQGAPLAPAFHRFLYPPRDSTTVVLNIGGIANITVIPPNGHVTGFDTGPGNILMDAWCKRHLGQNYDHNAEWAGNGNLITTLLDRLLADAYLLRAPPKSTGREHYNLTWLESQNITSESPQDIQRTLCEFTALSIARQVQQYETGSGCEVLVCGGGAHNPLLMQQLQHYLTQWQIMPSSARGIPEDYMEAMAFAWLARQRVHNEPSNLPEVTGAKKQASLGVWYSTGTPETTLITAPKIETDNE